MMYNKTVESIAATSAEPKPIDSQPARVNKGKNKSTSAFAGASMVSEKLLVPGIKGDGRPPTEAEIDRAVKKAETRLAELANREREVVKAVTPAEAKKLIAALELSGQ